MGNTSTRYQILTQDTRHRAINPDINQDKTRQDTKRANDTNTNTHPHRTQRSKNLVKVNNFFNTRTAPRREKVSK